jgi:hypothetical protein
MTYLSKPSVVWQKWRDPFLGSNDHDTHETLEDLLDEPDFIDDLNIDSSKQQEEDSLMNEGEESIIHKQQIKAIITPMGIIPYDEYNAASKIFNFWIGHTNFNISKSVSSIIENAEGVETLDIFTRYRFRIGIARLFKPSDVMSSITNHIYRYLDEHG